MSYISDACDFFPYILGQGYSTTIVSWERERDREREREKEKEREKVREREGETDGQTDRQGSLLTKRLQSWLFQWLMLLSLYRVWCLQCYIAVPLQCFNTTDRKQRTIINMSTYHDHYGIWIKLFFISLTLFYRYSDWATSKHKHKNLYQQLMH